MDNLALLQQIFDEVHQIHIILYWSCITGFGGLIVWFTILRPLWYFIGR